ncbi:MAG TPA: helix-turn-helix transcriptional regulator [Clostridiaceae bacterium]|nr:helix-turn-helix transcriptional regulator [Clostridiaceae bacterium]
MIASLFKSSVLKRYVGYYICLIAICVLILLVVYYVFLTNQFIAEMERTQSFKLEQAMETIDLRISEFGAIANSMIYDNYLTPFEFSQKENKRELIDRIASHKSRIEFIDTLIIHFFSQSNLYSNQGEFSYDTFTNYKFTFSENWDASNLESLMKNPEIYTNTPPGSYLIDRSGTQFIMLFYPWRRNTVYSLGSVIGLVKKDYFIKKLSDVCTDISGASYILDSDFQTLFSNENGASIPKDELIFQIFKANGHPGGLDELSSYEFSGIPDGKMVLKYNKTYYSVIMYSSKINQWKYITLFPHDQFTFYFFKSNLKILFVGTIVFIVCTLIGLYFAFKNYMPIYRLTQILGQDNSARQDELQSIYNTTKKMIYDREMLLKKLDMSKLWIDQSVLRNVVYTGNDLSETSHNNRDYEEELKKRLADAGISIAGPQYAIISLKISRGLLPNESDELVSSVRNIGNGLYYGMGIISGGYFAVFINVQDSKDRKKIAEDIYRMAEEILQVSPVVGVGIAYGKLSLLNRSLSESIAAINMSDTAKPGVYLFENIKTYSSRYPDVWRPSEAQLRLVQAVRQGDFFLINDSLKELSVVLSEIYDENPTYMHFIASSISISLLQLIDEMKIETLNSDIKDLIEFSTVEEYIERLKTRCHEIAKKTVNRDYSEKNNMFVQMIRYIDEHYMDENISLYNIANTFSTSTSTLSKLFKEYAGVNFIDYLTSKRISEACRLLSCTDMKIYDVMKKVGYQDLTSFTRKFTTIMGISPGKYRKEKQDGSSL